jgi:hypothetical protein
MAHEHIVENGLLVPSGSIGIGTIDPLTELHVAQNLTDANITIERIDATVGNSVPIGTILFRGGESTVADVASIEVKTDASWNTDDSPTRIEFHTTPAGSTTKTEVVRIDSNGRVGIGTDDPVSELHIAVTNSLPDITIERVDTVVGDGHDIGRISFRGGESTISYVASIWVQADAAWDDDDSPSRIIFNTTPAGSTTQTEVMRITSEGELGIGINPSAPLHVSTGDNQVAKFASTDNRASIIIADDTTTTFIGAESGSSYISNATNLLSDGQIVIDPDGNVGIGTSAPIAQLEVKGESSIDGTSPVDFFISDTQFASSWVPGAAFARLGFWSNDGSGTGAGLRGAITCNHDSSTGAGAELRLQTNDGVAGVVDRVVIDRHGKVGIGALDPDSELHIASSGGGIIIERIDTTVLDGNDIGRIYFRGGETTIDDVAAILVEADTGWDADDSPTKMSFWTTPANSTSQAKRMTINKDGNVGIGVTILESWDSAFTALQIGGNASIMADTAVGLTKVLDIVQNTYYDGDWKFISADEASRYNQSNGKHFFYTVDDAAEDSVIDWGVAAVIINNAGHLLVENDIKGTGTFDIINSTDDGSDNGMTRIGAGGVISNSRGAYIQLTGNEQANTGSMEIVAGNVSGGDIIFNTGDSTKLTIPDSGGIVVEADIIGTPGNFDIMSDTENDSDSKQTRISGGGGIGANRGGYITLNGNENANTGQVKIEAGNVSGGKIAFNTGSTERLVLDDSGALVLLSLGTTKTEASLYTGDTDPDSTARINYDGFFYATKTYNPVYNDIADFQDVIDEIIPGMCYYDTYEGAKLCTQRCQMAVMGIASDTFGMSVGSDSNKEKIPVAISGWVLAYVDQIYPCGTPLTNDENGYLTEMTKEEKSEYPERLIATYKKSEELDSWGPECINVNDRHWVKVK